MNKYVLILIGIFTILVIFFLPLAVDIDLGSGPNSLISIVRDLPFESAWYSIHYFSAI